MNVLFCSFPSQMFAARSVSDGRIGLLVGALLIVFPILFFGSVGILAQAKMNTIPKMENVALGSMFFVLLSGYDQMTITALLLVLATCLSVSTLDSLITSFLSLVGAEVLERHWNINWARLIVLIIFASGLILALNKPPSILAIFMIGNLACTATAPTLFLSLWDFVTPIGCALGLGSGLLSICIIGWINIRTFVGGLKWWLLPYGFYQMSALWTFLIALLTSTVKPWKSIYFSDRNSRRFSCRVYTSTRITRETEMYYFPVCNRSPH